VSGGRKGEIFGRAEISQRAAPPASFVVAIFFVVSTHYGGAPCTGSGMGGGNSVSYEFPDTGLFGGTPQCLR